MRVLLDTCAIIWIVSMPEKVSQAAVSVLEDKATDVYVSPISCAEIACLQERGKIDLDRHWKSWFDYYISVHLYPIGLVGRETS